MAIDYPDFGGVSGLSGAMATLTAAIDALKGGFGQGTAGWTSSRVLDQVGAIGELVAAPGGTDALVVMGLAVTWKPIGSAGRGWVAPRIFSGSGPTAKQLFQPNLTPRNPSAGYAFPPQSMTLAAATALSYDLTDRNGPPTVDQVLLFAYYYVTP